MEFIRGFYMVRTNEQKMFKSTFNWVEIDRSKEDEGVVQFKIEHVSKVENQPLQKAILEFHTGGYYVYQKDETKDSVHNIMEYKYPKEDDGNGPFGVCQMSADEPEFVKYVQNWYRDPIESLEVVGAHYREEEVFYGDDVSLEGNVVTIKNALVEVYPKIEAIDFIINGKKEQMRYTEGNPHLISKFAGEREFSNDMERSIKIVGENDKGETIEVYEIIGKTEKEQVIYDEFHHFDAICVYLDKPELFKKYGFEKVNLIEVYLEGKIQYIEHDRNNGHSAMELSYSQYLEDMYKKEIKGYEVQMYRKVTSDNIKFQYKKHVDDDKKHYGLLVELLGIGYKEESIEEVGVIEFK